MSGAPEDPIREADIRGGGGAKDSTRETTSQAGVGTASLRPLKRILIVGPDIKLTKEILDAYYEKKGYAKEGFLIVGDGKNPVSKDEIRDKIAENGGIDENTIITISAHGSAREGGGHSLWLHSPGNETNGNETKTILEELADIAPNRRGNPSKKTPLQIHLLACYAGAAASTSGDKEPDYSVLPEGSVLVAHGFHDTKIEGEVCDNIALAVAKSGDKGVFDQIISDCTLEMQNVSIGMRLPEGKCETIVLRGPRENLGLKDSLAKYFDGQWAQTLRDRIAADDGKLPASVKKTDIPTREQIAGKVTDNFDEYQKQLIFSITSLAETDQECAKAIEYIRQTGKKPDELKYYGTTLLSRLSSCKWVNGKIITALAAEGADPNTPLCIAATEQIAKALLAAGADPKHKDSHGRTTLSAAPTANIVKALIAGGADVSAADRLGYTPLHNAQTGAVALALIAGGAKLNARTNYGIRPSDIARHRKNSELIHILDVTDRDSDGKIYLHKCYDPKVATALIAAGAPLDAKDKDGKTPLHYASSPEVVLALIAAGAPLDAKDKDGKTPLHYAQKSEVALALIKAGALLETRDKDGKTPLDSAQKPIALNSDFPYEKNDDLIAILKVASGSDPNELDEHGNTLLFYSNSLETTKFLLSKGVDPKIPNSEEITPLHYASYREVVLALIEAGAEVNAKDKDGKTALDYALNNADFKNNSLIAFLKVASGGNPNETDEYGYTPLLYSHSLETTKFLLSKGADPNIPDSEGRTPLHIAFYPEVALALIEAGADLYAHDKAGKTPLDHAREFGFENKLLTAFKKLEVSRDGVGVSESKGAEPLDRGSVAAADRAQARAAGGVAAGGAAASEPPDPSVAGSLRRLSQVATVTHRAPSPTPSVKPAGVAAQKPPSPASLGHRF